MPRRSLWARTKRHLREEIQADFLLESELVSLTLATGIIDAASFPDGHIFISNQTGNSVLIAICTFSTGPKIVDLRDVALSLSCFILGGFVFGRLGLHFGSRKRGWMLCSSLIQTLCVAIATIFRSLIHHNEALRSPTGYAIIVLLALAFGGQVALARTVDVPEITTAMVTSAYIDVLVDPRLFCWRNRARNRRVSLLCSLIVGSFVGAWAYRRAVWFAYLLSGVGKAGVTLAFCFNKSGSGEMVEKGRFEHSDEESLEM